MSWSEAHITATCDNCRQSVELTLTETARGWDARYVDDELEDMGWLVEEYRLLCDECKQEE